MTRAEGDNKTHVVDVNWNRFELDDTEEFINAVSPELAVATGYLPISTKVQKRYAAVEATLLYDMSHGYIHVWSNGETLQFETSQMP